MANGILVRVLIHTDVTKYLSFKAVDGSYVLNKGKVYTFSGFLVAIAVYEFSLFDNLLLVNAVILMSPACLLLYCDRFTRFLRLIWRHSDLHWWDCLKNAERGSSSSMSKIIKKMIRRRMKDWTLQEWQPGNWSRGHPIYSFLHWQFYTRFILILFFPFFFLVEQNYIWNFSSFKWRPCWTTILLDNHLLIS